MFPRPEPVNLELLTQQQVIAMRNEYYGLGCRIGAIYQKYTALGWQQEDIHNAVYFRTYRWLG